MQSIASLHRLTDKRVLVRVDWNVPVKNNKVVDDFKIVRSLATIRHLQNAGARVILMSHLGRPTKPTPSLSLAPVVKRASKLLNTKIALLPFVTVGDRTKALEKIDHLKRHGVVMLENIRFCQGEEEASAGLAKDLAKLGDIFVLDGFAVAHRRAASVTGVAKLLPHYAGLLLSEEVDVLSSAMHQPKKPSLVILGGAKVETKIPVLKNVLKKTDIVLLGGGLVNTYLWAKGHQLGVSLIGKEYKAEILKYGSSKKVVMPIDVIVGTKDGKRARIEVLNKKLVLKKNEAIYDVGPATVQLFAHYIKKAQTLIWNGALGMFEVPTYSYGTKAVACLFAARSKGRAVGIAGGGETVELLQKLGLMTAVDLVSTGGGAMLEFLSGNTLPGLQSLDYK